MRVIAKPLAGLLVAAGVLVTGCSSPKAGRADPVSTAPSSSSGSESSQLSPSSSSNAVSTTGIDPCSLLDPSLMAQYGATEGPDTSGRGAGGRPCDYTKPVQNASEIGMAIGVNIRDTVGIDQVNDVGGGKQTGHLTSGRAAVQAPGHGGCTLALAVTSTSRVDVVVTTPDSSQACQIASKVADSVDSKLPKG